MDGAGTHGDTVIVMDDGERGWHDRFARVRRAQAARGQHA